MRVYAIADCGYSNYIPNPISQFRNMIGCLRVEHIFFHISFITRINSTGCIPTIIIIWYHNWLFIFVCPRCVMQTKELNGMNCAGPLIITGKTPYCGRDDFSLVSCRAGNYFGVNSSRRPPFAVQPIPYKFELKTNARFSWYHVLKSKGYWNSFFIKRIFLLFFHNTRTDNRSLVQTAVILI